MALASTVKVVLGSIAFAIFWVLAVLPVVPFLPVGRTAGSLLGGMLMVIFQVITADQAYAAIELQGEGSRSGANQARDGEGKGSSSVESQGQDRGEGSASGENQGGDRNAKGSGSSRNAKGSRSSNDEDEDEDEDERKRQHRVRADIEQGRQESNQEEINFSSIPETVMTIIGAVTIAVIDFHSNKAISSAILRLIIAINVFGFLCCMTSMLHRHRKPMAARIFGTIGVAAAGLGLLVLASVYFSSDYGFIILGLGSLAILVICVLAFRP